MASDPAFAEYVCEQIGAAGSIASKKMFGEYGIYCDEKMIGLVCDNQFFIKPTEPGRAFVGDADEAPPFPGAKPYLLIADLDDAEHVSALVRITAAALPLPKLPGSKSLKARAKKLRLDR